MLHAIGYTLHSLAQATRATSKHPSTKTPQKINVFRKYTNLFESLFNLLAKMFRKLIYYTNVCKRVVECFCIYIREFSILRIAISIPIYILHIICSEMLFEHIAINYFWISIESFELKTRTEHWVCVLCGLAM